MPDVPVSWGEVIDKITILEIKSERLSDEQAVKNVRKELNALKNSRDAFGAPPEGLAEITAELKSVNETLWQIEDDIRDCEREKDFGPKFIELARAVYKTNDKRAALKRNINSIMKSDFTEEKGYSDYE